LKAQKEFYRRRQHLVLVAELYKNNIMNALAANKKRNALPRNKRGSVICGLSMQTTNDMPIVYPPSFKTLGILPFDLNAHFFRRRPAIKTHG
jgi:dipeptidase E